MKAKYISHQSLKRKLLKDPEVREAYSDLEEEYQLINEMLKARERAGVSQADVAKKMRTTASAVSRLESLNVSTRPSPSLNTLKKYAHSLGCTLSIKLIPRKISKAKA
ncbi:MAG: transcriptional regulator [Legionellales bacterium]|nr:transcriptional regulator [Legionellales bacterium]|tara:strand:- start:1918 stop:2241 length:324 start_codon:yes stop_codon:yes gene_type:complete